MATTTQKHTLLKLTPRCVAAAMRPLLLCRYYDGQLVADDEMAAAAGGSECRDVVLALPPPEAPAGSMPRPAAAAGSGSGLVLLSRAYSEDKLYTQVRAAVVLLGLAVLAAVLQSSGSQQAALA
jgi:hypothetical protein